MAIQLFRLANETFPSISTSQASNQYFRTNSLTVAITSGTIYSILVSRWVNGAGDAPTAFATAQAANSLCINGVLQQSGLYSIVSTAVRITGPAGGTTIHAGYPITLQTYNASVIVSDTVSSVVVP